MILVGIRNRTGWRTEHGVGTGLAMKYSCVGELGEYYVTRCSGVVCCVKGVLWCVVTCQVK